MAIDIVDAQFHFGPGGIDQTLAMMDALGIAAGVVEEFWIGKWIGYPGNPGYMLPSGAFRSSMPTLELAATLHPTRFTGILKVDRRDPEVAHLIRLGGQAPHVRAVRVITPGMETAEAAAYNAGQFAGICAAACDANLPLFVFAPDQMAASARYARDFPSLKLVIDHCGVLSHGMRRYIEGTDAPSPGPEAQLAAFDKVLALADLPNVGLKWAHAASVFEHPAYPGEKLWPILRRALDHFGADRVMWGSDANVVHTGECWGEILFSMRGNPDLTAAERAAVLGGTVRKWLDWPAAPSRP